MNDAATTTSAGAKRGGEDGARKAHLPGVPGPCSSASPAVAHPDLVDALSPDPKRRFVLELFAGCSRTIACCLEVGLSVCCPLELSLGRWRDLTDRRMQRVIVNWITSGRIWLLHMGTPCTRWSGACTTGVHEPPGGLA